MANEKGSDKLAIEPFLQGIRRALDRQTFVGVTLGKSLGQETARKVLVSLVEIKGELRLRFVHRYATRDITENDRVEEAIARIRDWLGDRYFSGHLFATDEDLTVLINRRGVAKVSRSTPTKTEIREPVHNRKKKRIVEEQAGYLRSLGVATCRGDVKPTMAGKYKQINRFIELVSELIDDSELSTASRLSVIDIGSGKGYLTFALYDYLAQKRQVSVQMTGVELRKDLVLFCRQVASEWGMEQLAFVEGRADQLASVPYDMVIALHACDTATDEAIYQGIAGQAAVILCAPCCQHQIAPQLDKDHPSLSGLHRFGLFKQRQADLVTDASRVLLLQAMGYRVKVIEFVSTEHTSKNLMIAAVRDQAVDRLEAKGEYDRLKSLFGFREQALETRLRGRLPDDPSQ